ncbi:MAG: TonB family protein [Ignavibacterium sp.]|jgi:protein TonB|nr:TonB family protein [Ignavibacterium sp.]
MSVNKQTTDSELLLQIVGYNQEAYLHLYNRYSATIYSLIKEIVSNPKLSEKILINVFSVFLKRIEYYSTTSNNVFTWLTLLARNISLDVVKRMKYMEDIPIYSDEYEIEFILPNLSNEIDLLNLDERKILAEKVKLWKSHLSEIQNLIFSLVYFEGLNDEEIAKRLTVPVSQVRNKLIVIMDVLYQQFTGKQASSVKNIEVFDLIKLEPLGCITSEEKIKLNNLRENDPEFLWKELGEVQNLIALLSATIPIVYPPNDLSDHLSKAFIEILQGAEVEYPIITPEPPVINQQSTPLPDVININEIIEKREKDSQIQFSEPYAAKTDSLSKQSTEPIKEKTVEVSANQHHGEPIQRLNEINNKSIEEITKPTEPLKFRQEPAPAAVENKVQTVPSGTTTVFKQNKTQSFPAKDEVVVRNRLTPTSSINLKELFKNDKPLPNKPEPVTLKDLEEQIKPPIKQETVEQKKNDESDKVVSKQGNVAAAEKTVRETLENKTIDNNSDIKLKTNIPTKELKAVETKNPNEMQVSKSEKTEDQSSKEKNDIKETKVNLPVNEKLNQTDGSIEIQGDIKIRSHAVDRTVRTFNSTNYKSETTKNTKPTVNERPITPSVIQEVKPTAKEQIKTESVNQVVENKNAAPTPAQSKQSIQVKKAEQPAEVKTSDTKPFQEPVKIKPQIEKTSLKIRETKFEDNENQQNATVKTNINESDKPLVQKESKEDVIKTSTPVEKARIRVSDRDLEPELKPDTSDNEVLRLKKKLKRNIILSAALFIILIASGAFLFVQMQSNNENKTTELQKPIEQKQVGELISDVVPDDNLQSVTQEEIVPVKVEESEKIVKNEPKVNLPPLPESIDKKESTYFALNENNNPLMEENKETKQIAAAKTETIIPPTKKAPEEEEPAFFVAVEEMPQLIGGMKQLQSKIKYPDIAKRVGIEGKVLVQALVDENGDVVSVKTLKGIGAGCDEEAMDAVKKSKFVPGKQRGKNVKVQVTIPIVFKK